MLTTTSFMEMMETSQIISDKAKGEIVFWYFAFEKCCGEQLGIHDTQVKSPNNKSWMSSSRGLDGA